MATRCLSEGKHFPSRKSPNVLSRVNNQFQRYQVCMFRDSFGYRSPTNYYLMCTTCEYLQGHTPIANSSCSGIRGWRENPSEASHFLLPFSPHLPYTWLSQIFRLIGSCWEDGNSWIGGESVLCMKRGCVVQSASGQGSFWKVLYSFLDGGICTY